MMLGVKNLTASYAGIKALRGVDLSVAEGEIVALIGPNGAGKSTLLNALSGLQREKSGAVNFCGQDISRLAPHAVARLGLLQTPEGRQVLGPMSVLENLRIGELARGGRASAYGLKQVFALFPILEERQHQLSGNLSGGQQQMLAIGRALMGGPRMLLLDEPSLGLAPLITDQVFAALKSLNSEGLTILLVEQNAKRALAATSRGYVIEQGRIVHEGLSGALARDPAVIAHYLGDLEGA